MKKWAVIAHSIPQRSSSGSCSENEEIAFQARQDALFDGKPTVHSGIGLMTFGLCFAATPVTSIIITLPVTVLTLEFQKRDSLLPWQDIRTRMIS